MREAAAIIRRRTADAGRDAPAAAGFLQRHVPTWIIAVSAAILLAGVGAFETGDAPPVVLYGYWLVLALLGGALGALGLDQVRRGGLLRRRPVAAILLLWVGVTAAMTPVVYVLAGLALDGSWAIERLPHLGRQGLLVVGFFLLLQYMVERAPASPAAAAPTAPAATRATLSRLPLAFRAAALWAVEAQDHYLRVHTDRGATLILMRFGDALEELRDADGLRTHRSWWVARAAVADVRRNGHRASLTLTSGASAPVSRTFMAALRQAGWL